ncbi:FtsW/RodA/SpoVE family cell cycle protein [Spirulina sp. CS-785/01]|uniref:FtsW/RodA/SpoVE family cell cycle protein n=1 Tax=Spirulina sp. CS-785/01 TaxID=3021716 RepID=UPI00232CE18B|nr:FtsW/RodA/SpoVE family cell cycle protein [Spirulina sp. CS-785/01]MDB9314189.1 FtsW/RodA/SpoVE family cell cycle protein [Spirulina sp. CS-785/01]
MKTSELLPRLRYFIPFLEPDIMDWSMEARLLRWLTLLWLFAGLVVLFSASYPVADAEYGDGLYYFKRQLIWVLLGMVGFNVIVRSPLRYLLRFAKWGVWILLGLVIVTLIPGMGTTVNGATRWVSIASIPLQPSELIKPFLVLQSAIIFGQWRKLRWQTRFLWLFTFATLLGGILLQPNLSTTALCGITLWLIALAAGLPWLQLTATALSGVGLAVVSIFSQDYQRRRVMSFLNPWADPMQDGYQLIQSLLAVGSGGFWGAGFGLSQQKLFYLPIQYTDFIFAVFAEEFGFVGSAGLLSLLAIYATLAVIVAMKARQAIHQLIAIGATIFLVGQSILNIGVATGVLPTTGLPLPLFSYGGSSVISSLVLAALLVRVARESSGGEVISLQTRRASS